MGVGRFFCLGLPFALTFASLVCILIVGTGDVTNKSYYFAKFDTKNLSVSATSLIGTITSRDLSVVSLEGRNDGLGHLTAAALEGTSSSSSSSASSAASVLAGDNVTASDLGLADYYTVGLWSYCAISNSTSGIVTQKCSKAKAEFWFDPFTIWNLTDTEAETAINSTTLNDALKTYKVAARWSWILYLLAFIFTILELLLGVVAIFSRIGSCLTTIASNISSLTIVLASILATVMWSILTAGFNKELKQYQLHASISGKMLAVTWLAAAFSIASGFFWMISICCCGSTDRTFSRPSRRHVSDNEKLGPQTNAPYHPVPEAAFGVPPPPQEYGQTYQMSGAHTKPLPRNMETSYEPYRHENI